MDKKISDEFWQEKHNKWTQDLLVVQSNITKYEQANINFIEQGENFIKICNNAKDLYKYGCITTCSLININSKFEKVPQVGNEPM